MNRWSFVGIFPHVIEGVDPMRVILLVLATLGAYGEEYIFCIPKNFRTYIDRTDRRNVAAHHLNIGTVQATTVRVRIPTAGFDTTLTMAAASTADLELPGESIVAPDGMSKNAVMVTSNSPVAITATTSRFQCSEAFSVLPTTELGTSYVVASYSKLSADLTGRFSIVGTADGTQVRIAGPARSAGFDSTLAAGIMILLNKGEVWTYSAPFNKEYPCDPTGTLITATAPVSVISGHTCAYVPSKTEACNPLYEHLRPVSSRSAHTFAPPIEGRSFSIVRVIASAGGASITINDNEPVNIESQGFMDIDRRDQPISIESDRPVQMMLLAPGFKNGDSIGDPCMITVPDVGDMAREQIVTTVSGNDWDHYLTVILPPNHEATVTIDGKPLDRASFTEHRVSGHRWTSIRVTSGTHAIMSEQPVGVFVHGLGVRENIYDAYGFGGSTVIRK